MKKQLLILVAVAMFGAGHAQTLGPGTAEQYKEMVSFCCDLHEGGQHVNFDDCAQILSRYGFEYNKNGVVDMLGMKIHPFLRQEGEDTVGCLLSVIDNQVYTVSGVFSSLDASHAFNLIGQAASIQAEIAHNMGCTKYVGSVKGKVKKVARSHEEITEVLTNATVEEVSMVYESWKSPDGRLTITLVYNNKLYKQKKHNDKDRVELTLSAGNTMK